MLNSRLFSGWDRSLAVAGHDIDQIWPPFDVFVDGASAGAGSGQLQPTLAQSSLASTQLATPVDPVSILQVCPS